MVVASSLDDDDDFYLVFYLVLEHLVGYERSWTRDIYGVPGMILLGQVLPEPLRLLPITVNVQSKTAIKMVRSRSYYRNGRNSCSRCISFYYLCNPFLLWNISAR